MNIKLIALDLDGTLLDSQKRLSARNERALSECIRRGIEIVPCTGRIWSGVPAFIREFPGIHYAITTNGAVVENVVDHMVIKETKLSCEKAVQLLELGRQFHTMYDVYVGTRGFGELRFRDCLSEFGVPPQVQKMLLDTRDFVPDAVSHIKKLNCQAEKVNYFFGNTEERIRAKAALAARGDVTISSSFPYNLEINEIGATKGNGILTLAEYLGLDLKQTMGFGDGENDLTMMQMAGVGVAMGNAVDCVKAAADYVTDTNDEDGVAAAIERLVLNQQQ